MKRILSLTLLFCFGLLSSCGDKFLDTKPKAVVDPNTLQNRTGVNYLLVGAYSLLDGVGSGATGWHGAVSNWIYGSVASDDAYKGTDAGDQPEISAIEQFIWTTVNTHFRGKWRTVYDGVARSNDVLQMLEKVTDVTDEERTQITAEARFLRGYYHFEAKKMWNKVPYIDEKTYNPLDPNSTKVSNDKDIWPNIEQDLQYAYDKLPTTQSQKGRPTKYAAGAMLAKVYMFQGAGKYPQAKVLLEEIVNSGKYTLVKDFHDNFRAVTNNNAESVFEVQMSVNDGAPGGENGNNGDVLNYPYATGPGGCCGFFQPSQNLVNAYKTDGQGLPLLDTFNEADVTNDEGINSDKPFTLYAGTLDPRLDWTVGRRGVPYLDWGDHPGKAWIRDQSYAGPYSPKKNVFYKADVGSKVQVGGRNNAINFRMIRYSHVLLWLAEIEAEIGSPDKAREYVNLIRRRARDGSYVTRPDGTPAANYKIEEYPEPWTDKETALKAVRFEQRLEFAMEGMRFFDLVRWNIADQVLNTYLDKEKVRRAYLNGVSFKKGINEYYPIPEQEIINSSLNGQPTLKQNFGY